MTVARSLLTDGNREFLRGEREVSDAERYTYQMRSKVRGGIERLPDDLDLLDEYGHGDLVGEFYWRTAPVHRLRAQVKSFEERMMEQMEDK